MQRVYVGWQIRHGQLTGQPHAGYAGRIERSASESSFLSAAVKQRRQAHARTAAADIKRPASLGAVQFVCGHRQEVHACLFHVDGHLADCLGGVAEEQYTAFPAGTADLVHGIERPNDVIDSHCADKDRVVPNGVDDLLGRHPGMLVGSQPRNGAARPFKATAGLDDGLVLGLGDDHMPTGGGI
jgi:hypothetical protein